jgi:Tfp pilus assembly protein PilF
MDIENSLEGSFEAYHQQVKRLKDNAAWSDQAAILALLRQRDRIQCFIDQETQQPHTAEIPPHLLVALSQADAEVGRWSEKLLQIADLPTWRKSLNPPKHHWWWYPEPVAAPKPISEWLLGGLTLALLTLCLALAKDISARFLTGAPGIWSSIGTIAPAVLALFATGGILTKVGQQLIDTLFAKKPPYWPWLKIGVAAALTLLFFLVHWFGLPWAATLYHNVGQQQYFQAGKLASAQASFRRALQLNPDFPAANHSLALAYEDLRDFDSARTEYVKAVDAGYLKSVNNLARLQIVEDEDYESAAVLLLTALDNGERDRNDKELEYGLRKNLGWAWLEQSRLLEAEGELIRANRLEAELAEPRPDSYCLLGKLYEEQGKATDAQAQWQTCQQKIGRPEDDVWAAMASEALSNATSASEAEPTAKPTSKPTAKPTDKPTSEPTEEESNGVSENL